jgi:hypothetical protein
MTGIGHFFGRHFGAPFVMLRQGGVLSWILVAIWGLYPFAVQTVIHPTDAVGFQAWVQGLPISRYVTHQALIAGEVTAIIALVGLSLLQLGVLVLIYRRLQFSFSVWLLALLLIGGVANGIWYLGTGYFDLQGALAGLTPLVLVVVCEGVCERLGQDFVFGKGVRPHYGDVAY